MDFTFIFLHLLSSHLLLTAADQLSVPTAGFEELERTSFGRWSALATGGVAAILTLALLLVSKTRKQASSMERSGHPSLEVLRCFSFHEIVSAMERFSLSSSTGHKVSGDVYGELIDDGTHTQTVAIKWLSFDFLNEVKTLSKLRHGNLVSLVGYCSESRDMILVYEYMPLGPLAHNLKRNASLSWERRLRICIGAARGLDYLHTGTDSGIVAHGDLKSSNILLDENYKPKIAEFRLRKTDDTVEGAQKSDVYSFGIILLEVLCGKTSRNSSELISWAESLIGDDGHVEQIVDPRLNGQIRSKCLKEFTTLIRRCLHDDPQRRPTMVQVVARLELLSDNSARMVRAPSRAIVAEPRMREPSTSSVPPMPRNEESMFGDKLNQCTSFAAFEAATKNFSNCDILYDGFYTIYRTRRLFSSREPPYIIYRAKFMHDDISKFPALVDLSHPNLASLGGYYFKNNQTTVGYNEGHGLCLFYEGIFSLPWPQRLKVCIGAAEGLRFLHAANIIHGGICPATIFIDSSSCAKLATFGSVSSSWSTCENLPPDIAGSTKMTEKTDVYLFGLLLLIIFCGKKTDYSGGYPFLLPDKIFKAIHQISLYQFTDMSHREMEEKSQKMFLGVAFHCCRREQGDQPFMDAVLKDLKRAEALQTGNRCVQKTLQLVDMCLEFWNLCFMFMVMLFFEYCINFNCF